MVSTIALLVTMQLLIMRLELPDIAQTTLAKSYASLAFTSLPMPLSHTKDTSSCQSGIEVIFLSKSYMASAFCHSTIAASPYCCALRGITLCATPYAVLNTSIRVGTWPEGFTGLQIWVNSSSAGQHWHTCCSIWSQLFPFVLQRQYI